MAIFPLAPDQTIAQMWSNGVLRGRRTILTATLDESTEDSDVARASKLLVHYYFISFSRCIGREVQVLSEVVHRDSALSLDWCQRPGRLVALLLAMLNTQTSLIQLEEVLGNKQATTQMHCRSKQPQMIWVHLLNSIISVNGQQYPVSKIHQ